VNIRGGRKYLIRVFDGARDVAVKKIVGKGYWERVSLVFTAQTTGAHRLYLEKDSNSNTDVFFTDGWQLELCAAGQFFPTTYIDGDQSGFVANQVPPAYYWQGTPHASASVRSGLTRAGGRVLNFRDDLGFRLTSLIGFGMNSVTNVAIPNALIGGAFYQRTISQTRTFTIVGALFGDTPNELNRNRRLLLDTLKPDVLQLQQPLILRLQYQDHKVINVICNYVGGLEGNLDNYHQERLGIQFSAYNPYFILEEGDSSSVLSFADQSFTANFMLKRYPDGGWTHMGGSPNGVVSWAVEGLDGYIYCGGVFTMAGTVPANRIARNNPNGPQGGVVSPWERMGGATGANGTVWNIVIGFDGRVYACGEFTSMDGIANTRFIAVWNPATNLWSSLGTGLAGGTVARAMAVGLDGSIYVTGDFTSAGGVANTDHIAVWNPNTNNWNALGTGFTGGLGEALVTMLDGTIILGGSLFNSVSGVPNTARIARWNPATSSWSSIASSVTGSIRALATTPDGLLYAGGDFSAIGGITTSYVAKFNGTSWSSLGSGLGPSGKQVTSMQADRLGNLIVNGNFLTAGGLTLIDSVAVWNGSSWVYLAVNIGGDTISDVAPATVSRNNTLYLRPNSTGILPITEPITTIINSGESTAYPTIIFTGSGQLIQLSNWTTGDIIYFNLVLADNERAILSFQPGNISFVSNVRGNLMSSILAGSSLATFRLQPGANRIGCFILSAGTNASAAIRWQNSHWDFAGSFRQ
jgi:hypothetical protein